MSPTSTFKLLIDSKTASQFPRYRLCQTPCRPYASIRPSSVSAYAASQLSVRCTDESVNYCLPAVQSPNYLIDLRSISIASLRLAQLLFTSCSESRLSYCPTVNKHRKSATCSIIVYNISLPRD